MKRKSSRIGIPPVPPRHEESPGGPVIPALGVSPQSEWPVPEYVEPPSYTPDPYLVPGFDEFGREAFVARIPPETAPPSDLSPVHLPPVYRGLSPSMRPIEPPR